MQFLGATYFGVIFNIWQSILYCCKLYTVYKYSQAAAADSTSISSHSKKKSNFNYPVMAFFTVLYTLRCSVDWFCNFSIFWRLHRITGFGYKDIHFYKRSKKSEHSRETCSDYGQTLHPLLAGAISGTSTFGLLSKIKMQRLKKSWFEIKFQVYVLILHSPKIPNYRHNSIR